MEITAKRLNHVLKLAETCTPKRHIALDILKDVLVAGGRLTATNLERAIFIDLPEAGDAAFCVPFKALAECNQGLPPSAVVRISVEGDQLSFDSEHFHRTSHVDAIDEYPPASGYSGLEGRQNVGPINGNGFMKALEAVVPYAAKEETRPVLTAVCITMNGKFTFVGADGSRLGLHSVDLGPHEDLGQVLLPKESALALAKVWRMADKTHTATPEGDPSLPTNLALAMRLASQPMLCMSVYPARKAVCFQSGEFALYSQLVDGAFPDYTKVILGHEVLPYKVTFDAQEMQRALRPLVAVAKDASGIIRLEWEGHTLHLSARSEESGEAHSEITVDTAFVQRPTKMPTVGPAKIAFDYRYLLDYLAKREGPVLMETVSPSSPARFSHKSLETCLLMPMSVQ